MDPLSDMLAGIRAAGSSVNQAVLAPPWKILLSDNVPLTMLTVVNGAGFVVLPDGTELKIAGGDTALVRGPGSFHLVDDPSTFDGPHRSYEIACFDPDSGCELDEEIPDVDAPGVTTLIVGAYRATSSRHERLLRTLPPALVLNEDAGSVGWLDSMREILACRDDPGAQAMIDRVLDWGLVCTLGCWFERQGADAPAWYRGAMDPVAGPALEAMHRRPHHGWTVEALAAEAQVSRANFAKRFTTVMGQPVLSYLTDWRMHRAEDLLTDPDQSVAQVAKAVGYADPFAFSTAFKRQRGMSPRQFRADSAGVRQ